MQNIQNKIVARFKVYEKIVQLSDNNLYQLEHCPGKRTKKFRQIKYNEKRKAFYINGQLVTKNRLIQLRIKP
jgi:hypothetical protein